MTKKNPTAKQIAKIVTMLANGEYDREFAQAIIDRQVEIIDRPLEQAYRIHVSYAKLPGIPALEEKFSGKGRVTEHYDGREWERHSSCAKIDETPGERDFRVAVTPAEFFGKRLEDVWNELAAHFDREGYRFAIETELVEFADAQPELQLKYWILAPGSSASGVGGLRFVSILDGSPILDGEVSDRLLGVHWVSDTLEGRHRLLLVRTTLSAL